MTIHDVFIPDLWCWIKTWFLRVRKSLMLLYSCYFQDVRIRSTGAKLEEVNLWSALRQRPALVHWDGAVNWPLFELSAVSRWVLKQISPVCSSTAAANHTTECHREISVCTQFCEDFFLLTAKKLDVILRLCNSLQEIWAKAETWWLPAEHPTCPPLAGH